MALMLAHRLLGFTIVIYIFLKKSCLQFLKSQNFMIFFFIFKYIIMIFNHPEKVSETHKLDKECNYISENVILPSVTACPNHSK